MCGRLDLQIRLRQVTRCTLISICMCSRLDVQIGLKQVGTCTLIYMCIYKRSAVKDLQTKEIT